MTHRVEPTGRDDEWEWQVVLQDDGCIVGWFMTEERAQEVADNDGEAPLTVPRHLRDEDDGQLEMFEVYA
jgi:hypothetical protein